MSCLPIRDCGNPFACVSPSRMQGEIPWGCWRTLATYWCRTCGVASPCIAQPLTGPNMNSDYTSYDTTSISLSQQRNDRQHLSHSHTPAGAGTTKASAALNKEHATTAAGIPEASFILVPIRCAALTYIYSPGGYPTFYQAGSESKRFAPKQEYAAFAIAVIKNIDINKCYNPTSHQCVRRTCMVQLGRRRLGLR